MIEPVVVIEPVIVAALGNGNDPVFLIAPPERSRNQRTGSTDSGYRGVMSTIVVRRPAACRASRVACRVNPDARKLQSIFIGRSIASDHFLSQGHCSVQIPFALSQPA